MMNYINEKSYKNIFFDLDSTLVKIEGLDELARRKGKYKEVSELTKKSMGGELKLEEVFERKMATIAPNKADLDWLGQKYLQSLTEDAKDVIQALKYIYKHVFLITGNFRPAVEKVAAALSIDKHCILCNEIYFTPKGEYQGFSSNSLLSKSGGKAAIICSMPLRGRSMLVGDGGTDLDAKEVVDLFVGFGGVVIRENVKKQSEIFIESQSISPILLLACNDGDKLRLAKSPHCLLLNKAKRLAKSSIISRLCHSERDFGRNDSLKHSRSAN